MKIEKFKTPQNEDRFVKRNIYRYKKAKDIPSKGIILSSRGILAEGAVETLKFSSILPKILISIIVVGEGDVKIDSPLSGP